MENLIVVSASALMPMKVSLDFSVKCWLDFYDVISGEKSSDFQTKKSSVTS